jgi:glycosyltransferase involved in cell wall biosynthesis
MATIVLPVHNMERTLRPEVTRILDLAEALGRRLQVAIVDDGSQDATYEIACELAREFPQVRVLRQPYQRGLGSALEQVHQRLRVTQVVVHDGVAAIDVDELAETLAAGSPSTVQRFGARRPASDGCGSRRMPSAPLAAVPRQARPGSIGSFRWLRLDEPISPRRSRAVLTSPSKSAMPVKVLN